MQLEFKIGPVPVLQGYTDLAAPFIHVFQTDWEAWWALHALVGCRLRHAFAADSAIEAVREDLAEVRNQCIRVLC